MEETCHEEGAACNLPLLDAKFSEHNESLAVLNNDGLQEVSLQAVDQIQSSFIQIKDAYIIERVQDQLAVVLNKSPEKLQMWNLENGQLCLVLCLKDRLLVLDLGLRILREVQGKVESCPVMALCHQNGWLAFPTSRYFGHVKITCISSQSQNSERQVHAHHTAIAALAFSQSGDKIATASATGTLIRVFCMANADMLMEFRRGSVRGVDVSCLAFCKNDTYLTLASNTETVHVFKLERTSQGWMGSLASSGWFGSTMKAYANQERAFACAYIPTHLEKGSRKVCTILSTGDEPRLLVFSLDGDLLHFKLPSQTASQTDSLQCQLIQHHRIQGAMSDNTTP